MAKKSKTEGKKASGHPADALLDVEERTFEGAAGGASGAPKRISEVFEDFGAALVRLRETLDERRATDTLELLREEVRDLGRRVSALERQGRVDATGSSSTPGGSKTSPGTKASSSRAKRPASSRAKSRSGGSGGSGSA